MDLFLTLCLSGVYDDEYIDYIYKVLEKAGENGLKVFIDVHQDCVSSPLCSHGHATDKYPMIDRKVPYTHATKEYLFASPFLINQAVSLCTKDANIKRPLWSLLLESLLDIVVNG